MSTEKVPISVGSFKANLPVLSSQSHYRTWAQTWQVLLMGSDYWGVVTDFAGDKETRPPMADDKATVETNRARSLEIKAYDKKNNSTLAAILAGVSTELQRIVVSFVAQEESARLA
ncbi:hypothetical protein K3495_g8340 [Podosphaera aphanis]|nr:hypothetical protein K3495_g8340 [Podosphaera aphanis]